MWIFACRSRLWADRLHTNRLSVWYDFLKKVSVPWDTVCVSYSVVRTTFMSELSVFWEGDGYVCAIVHHIHIHIQRLGSKTILFYCKTFLPFLLTVNLLYILNFKTHASRRSRFSLFVLIIARVSPVSPVQAAGLVKTWNLTWGKHWVCPFQKGSWLELCEPNTVESRFSSVNSEFLFVVSLSKDVSFPHSLHTEASCIP